MPKVEHHLKRHHDDEFFDEIRIWQKPRYKTSALSGDEWRVSAVVELYRKGTLVYSEHRRDIATAVGFLPGVLVLARENLPPDMLEVGDELCSQPGCREAPVSTYRLMCEWCDRCGEPETHSRTDLIRRFCRRHLRRGNCGVEDEDANYMVLEGPGPEQAQPAPEDESPAAFGGVIDLKPGD